MDRLWNAVVVLTATVLHIFPVIGRNARLWEEHRQLGTWLGERMSPDVTVMAATPVVSYYADAGFEVLPYDDMDRIVRYARNKDVQYIVADRAMIPLFRPQLTRLLNPARHHPGLELEHALHVRSPRAIFLYRVLPASGTARY